MGEVYRTKGFKIIMWIVTIFSILGIVLNIYKRKECFVVWSLTNFIWAMYDWHIGAREQSVLFFVYFLLALWGLYKW